MKLIKCNWTNRKIKHIVYQKEGSFFENVKKNMKYQIRCKKHTKFASIKFCDFANFRKSYRMLKISRSWFTKFCFREFFSSQWFAKLRSHKIWFFKDTHREKAPSNETPVLTKSKNMGIWVVGTTNQLFMRGS